LSDLGDFRRPELFAVHLDGLEAGDHLPAADDRVRAWRRGIDDRGVRAAAAVVGTEGERLGEVIGSVMHQYGNGSVLPFAFFAMRADGVACGLERGILFVA